ncbi:flagellar synthesis regulator FleN [Vogesella sp. LIG4]|uniref:MinD/ParA family ATP-binding protein n=1 Tax=Vogesella sp. LIG4 TaxID=1192162 RepID=UPI0008200364|nr:flagellar synthesis regulator FleN [Vogesella sp. LIG4]SCK06195.1 flagellar biosynthesis protein FlhG [Vogesella sp. LIG4]
MVDQASGLRQASAHYHYPPSFAFFGGEGSGVSSVVGELAASLAMSGQRPLLVEHQPGNHQARRLGLPASASFASLAISLGGVSDLLVNNRYGLSLINLVASNEERTRMSPRLWRRLASEFAALETDHSVLLIDPPALVDDPAPLCIADNLVLVLSPDADSLTQGYASLKRLAGDYARRRFNVLVNQARDFNEAQAVFTRLSAVAGDYLSVALRWVGFVPTDNTLRKSQTLRRPTVEAFGDSEAAQACSQLAQMLPHWHAPDSQAQRASYLEQLLMTSKSLADLTGN